MTVKITRLRFGLIFSALLLAGSLYFLWLIATPQLDTLTQQQWNTPVAHTAPLREDRLYVPKLKLNLPFKTGDASVLNDAIWHRYPERGDPKKGGNFILAGHRFHLGLTPGEVRRKSPFYRLDYVKVNDRIYVDYNGKRYEYIVVKRRVVKPNDTSIEDVSSEPKMTLYSCTFGGTWDGRDVVIATLTHRNIDPSIRF